MQTKLIHHDTRSDDQIAKDVAEAHKRQARDDETVRVIGRYRLRLCGGAREWRATGMPQRGKHPLQAAKVTCVLTDGIIGAFVLEDGRTVFYAHMKAFEPDEKERTGRAPGATAKSRTPKRLSVTAALSLLMKKQQQQTPNSLAS